jgi:hypothetical protein
MQCGGTPIIGMFRQDTPPSCLADRNRLLCCQSLHNLDNVAAIARRQHFSARCQEHLDSVPCVGDETGTCARHFE